ncbi:MAG: hypothetical protein ABIC04_00790 [Nanoarchaeota archaeon]
MFLVGVTTLIALSLVVISYYYSNQVEDTVGANQVYQISREIVGLAESMYYFGEPSRTTLKVFMPNGIKSATVGPDRILFQVSTHSGDSDITYKSAVNLQGNLSKSYGYHLITIEAKEGYVWINST